MFNPSVLSLLLLLLAVALLVGLVFARICRRFLNLEALRSPRSSLADLAGGSPCVAALMIMRRPLCAGDRGVACLRGGDDPGLGGRNLRLAQWHACLVSFSSTPGALLSFSAAAHCLRPCWCSATSAPKLARSRAGVAHVDARATCSACGWCRCFRSF